MVIAAYGIFLFACFPGDTRTCGVFSLRKQPHGCVYLFQVGSFQFIETHMRVEIGLHCGVRGLGP